MSFDPLSPAFQEDPYPTYAALRQLAPLVWHADTATWYASAYDDVSALLRDKRLGRAPNPPLPPAPPELSAFRRIDEHSLFDMEPPDHTRLRGLVSQAFTPRRVAALQPRLQALAGQLLAAQTPGVPFDLLEDYAAPLSVALIADLLGVPVAERARLRPWAAAIVAMYEMRPSAEDARQAEQAAAEFWDYLTYLAAQRRAEPQDDLITALTHASDPDSGARLSATELVSTCILLLNAGHEATVNGFGNGMCALFAHPDQLAALAANPSTEALRGAVEEMLRYDTPLQFFRRWVYEGFDYRGCTLHPGDQVGLFFGAANRDPQYFPDPDRFDITRRGAAHLTFGAGMHYCLGAPLARLELNTALETLLRHAPHLRLLAPPQRKPSFVIRGMRDILVVAE